MIEIERGTPIYIIKRERDTRDINKDKHYRIKGDKERHPERNTYIQGERERKRYREKDFKQIPPKIYH